jgi:hypothetical protein
MNDVIATTDVPEQVPGYHAETIGEEMMLYSVEKTKAVYLNQAASIVWMLCDNKNTVGEIIETISAHFTEEPAAELGQEVSSALSDLLRKNVITVQ